MKKLYHTNAMSFLQYAARQRQQADELAFWMQMNTGGGNKHMAHCLETGLECISESSPIDTELADAIADSLPVADAPNLAKLVASFLPSIGRGPRGLFHHAGFETYTSIRGIVNYVGVLRRDITMKSHNCDLVVIAGTYVCRMWEDPTKRGTFRLDGPVLGELSGEF